jgi:hypothetical protein
MNDQPKRLRLPPGLPSRTANFGSPIAEFRACASRVLFLKVISLGALGVGAVVFVLLLGLMFFEEPHPESATKEVKEIYKSGAFGVVLICAGIVGWRSTRRTQGMRVFVCPEGIARIQGGKGEALRWNEVVTVQRVVKSSEEVGPVMTGMLQLNLTGSDGQSFSFSENLTGLRELRQLVERLTLGHLQPAALNSLEENGSIQFGKIQVTREGLSHDSAVLCWDDYESAEVSHGELMVTARGTRKPFCKVLIEHVPNSHVLFALAERNSTAKG